jgi:hypothetical protein
MANEYGPGYWKIDTTGILTTSDMYLEKIVFQPSAASQAVTIKDSEGNTFWGTSNALAATPIGNVTEDFRKSKKIRGINITALTSGATLYLYFDEKGG